LRLKYDEDLQIKAKELVLLKRQSQIADKEIEMLQKENNQLREQFDLNKENYSANLYHNKLATINLELALAQNIYDKILKAKCRGNEP
jgi:cell shape-determining protein MreC